MVATQDCSSATWPQSVNIGHARLLDRARNMLRRVRPSRGSDRRRSWTHGLAALAFVACLAMPATGNAQETKNKLTFATVSTEEMSLVAKQWEAPLKYLGDKLGVEIEYYATTSYAAVVEAMMGGFVDVALLSPEIYILAIVIVVIIGEVASNRIRTKIFTGQ